MPTIGAYLKNQGSLSTYKPSLGEKIEDYLADTLGKVMGERKARHIAQRAFSAINDLTPVGNATGMDEGSRQFKRGVTKGDIGQALLGAGVFGLSAAPLPRGVKKAGKTVAKQTLGNVMKRLAHEEDGAIRAWHGSPHDFDKFSIDKIGTGEGAQAYGHGLYFAEAKDTARSYQDQLAGKEFMLDGQPVGRYGELKSNALGGAVARLNQIKPGKVEKDNIAAAVQRLEGIMATSPGMIPRKEADDVIAAMHSLEGREVGERLGGRLYEVNINAEPEDFLDWDAPITEQPAAIKNALGDLVPPRQLTADISPDGQRGRFTWDDDGIRRVAGEYYPSNEGGFFVMGSSLPTQRVPSAEDARRIVMQGVRAPEYAGSTTYGYVNGMPLPKGSPYLGLESRRAPKMLLDRGIPGIRYLDQGSRTAQDGTRNYVVFDDSLIDILNKF